MELLSKKYPGPDETGREMKKSSKFSGDLKKLAALSLPDFFDFVKNIDYKSDPETFKTAEIVARPKNLLSAAGLDCKKKAVLIAAWCNAQKPPVKFEFVASSERPDKKLHHVFPIIRYNKSWIIADATYKTYFLGEPKKKITRVKIL